MADRLIRGRNKRQLLSVLLVLLFSAAGPATAQITNGDFETGDLSGGWTTGGGNRVEVLEGDEFSPDITAPEGDWLVLITTGPDDVSGAPGGDFDGNGATDYDSSTLSISFDTTVPVTLSFLWDFFTAEADQPDQYDDFFITTVDGVNEFSRSVYNPGGISPFPDTAPYDGNQYQVNSNGPTDNNNFRSGRSGLESFQMTIDTAGTHTLEFLIADQSDSQYDSGLLIDDVRVEPYTDLWITKDDGVAVALPGQPLTYVITVGNDGPNDAAGALVTDVFPAELLNVSWTCASAGGASCPGGGTESLNELVDLPVGSTVTFTTVSTVDPNASGTLSNTATVDVPPDMTDSDTGNNSATDTDSLDPSALPVQVTDSSGDALILKDGGFHYIFIANHRVGLSDDGRVLAFVSNGDYTGGNGDLGNEIFVHTDNGGFEQITDVPAPVAFDHAADPALSRNGRYLVFASSADHTGGNPDWNREIFRLNRNDGTMTQITHTTTGAQGRPTVSNNGRRIAFTTTSSDLLSGFNADGNQEVAVWNNGALSGFESTGCLNHTPMISRHNQGRYLAFISDGDLTGNNPDRNQEVFQWRWEQGDSGMNQVTDSPGAQGQGNDVVCTTRTGNLLAFLSNADYTGQNGDNSLEVFTWNRTSDSFTQITDTNQLVLHTSVAMDDDGEHLAYERFNILSGTFEIHYVDLSSGSITPVVTGEAYLPAIGVTGSTPVLVFESTEDYVGQNGDGNSEIWKALVE